jgi:hypothetical protein
VCIYMLILRSSWTLIGQEAFTVTGPPESQVAVNLSFSLPLFLSLFFSLSSTPRQPHIRTSITIWIDARDTPSQGESLPFAPFK